MANQTTNVFIFVVPFNQVYRQYILLQDQNPIKRFHIIELLTLAALILIICCGDAIAEVLKGNVLIESHESAPQRTGDYSLETGIEGGSRTLPAGIKFSETVEPVPQQLKMHKLFSSVTMPNEDKEDSWYQIPTWRAGLFRRETQTDHTIFGDVTSVSKAEHLYGMQVDKKGGIWHHVSWPQITRITLEGHTQYKIINRYEPVVLSTSEFCVKVSSTDVDVDDKTGKIIRLAKQEEFDRYFPGPPNTAIGDCLMQGFSVYGRPNTTVERTSVEETMIQPFKVVNSFRGKNYRDSFKQYLQSHDLAELVPD